MFRLARLRLPTRLQVRLDWQDQTIRIDFQPDEAEMFVELHCQGVDHPRRNFLTTNDPGGNFLTWVVAYFAVA